MKPRKQYTIEGKDVYSRHVTASDIAWALGVEGYASTATMRESAAGSFANTVYLVTNAPIDRIRYYAAQGGVTVRKNR